MSERYRGPRARPRGLYAHCMEILEESGGRGYFHGCSNAIFPGTSVENVWGMMEARDDYCKGCEPSSSDRTANRPGVLGDPGVGEGLGVAGPGKHEASGAAR